MMSSIVSLNDKPSYHIYKMSPKDMHFFDRFSGDVYKTSLKQLKKFCSKALCRVQPNTAEQEPWLMKYHEVMKRIREMYCDEFKQTISWLEKEKTNFQPLPRLGSLERLEQRIERLKRLEQRIERLKKRLDEAKLQLGYSLNPWWRK